MLNILFIFCILVVGYKGNWWFQKVPELPITKVELNAEKTRIFIPYLGSRNELLTFLNHEFVISHYIEEFGQGNENPHDYTITPLSAYEIKELNEELITRVKTTFFSELSLLFLRMILETSLLKLITL